MSSMVLEMPTMTTLSGQAISAKSEVQARLKTVHNAMLAGLKQQYRIPDEGRVFAFLHQHSQLIGVLQEGRAVVSLLFGEETPIKLHMQRDPETGDECLIAWIQTALPASEAVDLLFALDDSWFSERLHITGELLNFTLGVA